MKIIFIAMSFLLLVSCGRKKTTEQASKAVSIESNSLSFSDEQFKSAGIELGKLEPKSISSVIKTNGTIDVPPQNMITVSMPLGGYLKSSKLLPGMQIRRGEVIATMQDQQYIQLQQEYLLTKSKLAYSQAEYIRQKELNQSKASSDKVFQQTQMEFSNQKINLKALAEKLRLININPNYVSENNITKSVNIYSPINGFVSKINVNVGKFVNPSDVLFELIDPSEIHLNLKVFEKDLDKLYVGQKLNAYTNNDPDRKYPCTIILVSKDLSPERIAQVHGHFQNFDKTLVPGMYMNADIEVKSYNTFVIPEDAIVNYEGANYLFISKATNQFEMMPVETGITENNLTEVKNNSSFTDKQVVKKGAYTLLMALKNKSEE